MSESKQCTDVQHLPAAGARTTQCVCVCAVGGPAQHGTHPTPPAAPSPVLGAEPPLLPPPAAAAAAAAARAAAPPPLAGTCGPGPKPCGAPAATMGTRPQGRSGKAAGCSMLKGGTKGCGRWPCARAAAMAVEALGWAPPAEPLTPPSRGAGTAGAAVPGAGTAAGMLLLLLRPAPGCGCM